jgi:AAA family ATP:ADP antiporter
MNLPIQPRTWLSRVVDVRREEIPAALQAFVILLLILLGHTVLETARDALLITRLPPRSLGIVYVAVAVCVLPAAALASKVSARLGPRRALGGSLVLASTALVVLFVLPTTQASVVGLYVASGLVGAVVVPQFWGLVGSFFTVAQARRLLGPIAAAGVIGATLGSTAAVGLLAVLRVKGLLLVASGILLLVVVVVTLGRRVGSRANPAPEKATPLRASSGAMRTEPFLRRIALLVVLATATALAVDYFFKWTVSRSVAPTAVAGFVARYYAVLNGLSLLTQVFVSGALVRRMGVATAVIVTPMLLALGAVGALAFGGALAAVLVLRAVDGALINSVHRVTAELVYLPVPANARARAKPFIDGALARLTQAVVGVFFLALGAAASPRIMAAVAVVLALAWVGAAVTTRRPYLDLLRRAIDRGTVADADPIDLESASALVQLLASDQANLVTGAMNALARRGRERLIPALVLLHEDETVVVRALSLFGESSREEWIPRARRLLRDERDPVRKAAARALARHRQLDPADMAQDVSPWVQGYVALHASIGSGSAGAAAVNEALPKLPDLLARHTPGIEELRLGVLSAIADVPRNRSLLPLLLTLAEQAPVSREWTEGLARAAAVHHATVLIPDLLERLPLRDGREAIRDALATLGSPALLAVWGALRDETRGRSLRVHLPGTLARFGTREAADLLLESLEVEVDGLVRYKALRALQRLVVDKRFDMSRERIEKLLRRNLEEYLRLTMLGAPFEGSSLEVSTERLLVRLLDDKRHQAIERSFRLLQIAHPAEDIQSVRFAFTSKDRRARANAIELVDTLLGKRDQRALSAMLRLATDELPPAERAARATPYVKMQPPASVAAALVLLGQDADGTVAALAQLQAATLAGETRRVAIARPTGAGRAIELETSATAIEAVDA